MDTQRMSDEALLTEYLKTKDHGLFAALYERMRKRMYAHAVKVVKSPETAEEIVQEVFCKLLEVAPQKIRSAESFLVQDGLDPCPRSPPRGPQGNTGRHGLARTLRQAG